MDPPTLKVSIKRSAVDAVKLRPPAPFLSKIKLQAPAWRRRVGPVNQVGRRRANGPPRGTGETRASPVHGAGYPCLRRPVFLRCPNRRESSMSHTRDLTITLTADEANAAVEAIALAVRIEADMLGNAGIDNPGDLHRVGRAAQRIGALADLGTALKWRKHWGPIGGIPEAVTAPEAAWVYLLGELQKRADELVTCELDPADVFEFDATARTVARAFAAAEPVGA